MKTRINNQKGQLSIEAAIVMVFLLIMIGALWFSGPVQQAVEKSTDTNGILLASKTLDQIDSAVTAVGMSGIAETDDMIVHVPFITAYAAYEDSSGPTAKITVLLYSNISGVDGIKRYRVNQDGAPFWMPATTNIYETSMFYINVTRSLSFPLENFPLCDPTKTKPADQLRGPGTLLRDENGSPIKLCCESGFNLRLYAEKSNLTSSTVGLYGRHYYNLGPGNEWTVT